MRPQTTGDKRRSAMRAPAQVGGRNFYPRGGHPDGTKVIVTGGTADNPPRHYHASTPDPNNPGRRLFWLFLSIGGVIGWIALGLPLW